MKNSKNAWVFVMIALMLVVGGCCGGSSKTKVESISNTKTVGEQMIDLQKAYEGGAMSEKEYKKAKEGILDKLEK